MSTEIVAIEKVVPASFNPMFAQHARTIRETIRELKKHTQEKVISIGWSLAEVRNQAEHGEWLRWLNTELGWSDQTARNFINVYELSRDPKAKRVLDLSLPLRDLYLLAAPSTPSEALERVAERIEAGEEPSHDLVTEAITKVKAKGSAPQRSRCCRAGRGCYCGPWRAVDSAARGVRCAR
jgi:hypothetical protein